MRTNNKKVRVSEDDPLGSLLIRCCPPTRQGLSGSIARVAEYLEMTRAGIYRWINEGRVPPRQAKRLVEWRDRRDPDRVSLEDFKPYIFG